MVYPALRILAERYPSLSSAASEVATLRATKELPKGVIHVISDIHGENQKLRHVINNASGPRIDLVIDYLMHQPNVSLVWGNHDAIWMGACLGQRALIATVLRISLRYLRMFQIEEGYGILTKAMEVLTAKVMVVTRRFISRRNAPASVTARKWHACKKRSRSFSSNSKARSSTAGIRRVLKFSTPSPR